MWLWCSLRLGCFVPKYDDVRAHGVGRVFNTGRLISRFSQDTSQVDTTLPGTMLVCDSVTGMLHKCAFSSCLLRFCL